MAAVEIRTSRGRLGLIWAGLCLATLAAYWPALHGGFIWDDNGHVTKAGLRSLHGLWRIWFELGATQQYYPVLHSAFWVEHRLWGDATLGYHLVNVVLHATSAFLFAVILRRLKVPGAWLAALIFALHPVCVESVAWISEQKNTLSTVFYLLSALFYLQWSGTKAALPAEASAKEGRPCLYLGASLFFILALLSKSVTATLPAALLVIIWWRHGRLSWKRDIVPLLPWLAIGMAAGLFTAWVERTYGGAQGAAFNLTFLQRGLLAGRVICFYLGKLFWPTNLIFIYPHWQIDAGALRTYLFSAAVLALLAALWLLRKRTRSPLAALLFFAGSLFPALGFFNVYPFQFSYVADHFQYLASFGIIALVAGGLTRFRPSPRRSAAKTGLPLASCFSALLLLLVLGALTFRQCALYHDEETLYRITLEKNPRCWMAYLNLGDLFFEKGRMDGAIADYEAALRLKPDYSQAHYNLGNALAQTGRMDEAIAQFKDALEISPGDIEVRNNLGIALAGMGRLPEASGQFAEVLRLQPNYVQAHNNLGSVFAGEGRFSEAEGQYEAALRIEPDNIEAHYNLGLALARQNRLIEAKAEFEQTLRLKPDYLEARKSLQELELAPAN